MKKQLILCGLAAAVAGMAYATVDKLNFIKNDEVIKTILINSIDHLSYHGDTDGFTHIDVTSHDGSVTSYSLDGIDHVAYVNGLPENPVSVTVEPHHACATLHVTTSDPNTWYRFNGVPESELAGIPEDQWLDYLIEDDLNYIYDISVAYGYELDRSFLPNIFERGDKVRDWFPPVVISDNTPIALAVYTGDIVNGEIVLTSEPELIRFTTKELYDLGVKFNFSFDVTSTTLTVKADAYHPEGGDANIPFAIELYSPAQIAEKTLAQLVSSSIGQYENLVYNYGQKWDDVTYREHGEKTYTNRCQGDLWLAVAFGCEYGVPTTDASYEWVEIPEAEVIDDCTFDVEFTQKSGSEGTFTITPSNPDTRYTTFLIESDRFDGENAITPSLYLAGQVYYINAMNTFQWSTTEYVHTGATELNSKNDVIDGKYLRTDVEYSLFVFGVDEVGGRTTEIKELRFSTVSKPKEELTFDIKFSNFKGDSNWTHYIDVKVTPSDPNAKYVLNSHKMDATYFPESMSDEEFMKKYLDAQGEYLTLYSGDTSKTLSFGSEYQYPVGNVWTDYIVYVFGYDGGVTTPLYAYLVNTETGEVTPYRIPETKPVEKTADFTIEFSNFKGDSNWTHYIDVKVTPADPDMQYVLNSHKMDATYFPESMSDEEFMKKYLDAQGEYLTLYSGDTSKTLSFGSDYQYPVGNVWTDYIVYVFGYDGGVTTPLYAYIVNTETGEVTPYRIPETKPVEKTDDFTIEFSNFKGDSNWTHYIDVKVTPADPDMQYVLNSHKMDATYFPESMSDEEFMKKYLDAQGSYLTLNSGDTSKTLSFGSDYQYPVGNVWTDYIVYVFGYDGGVITPLYAYIVNTETGEVTPYRIPEK